MKKEKQWKIRAFSAAFLEYLVKMVEIVALRKI